MPTLPSTTHDSDLQTQSALTFTNPYLKAIIQKLPSKPKSLLYLYIPMVGAQCLLYPLLPTTRTYRLRALSLSQTHTSKLLSKNCLLNLNPYSIYTFPWWVPNAYSTLYYPRLGLTDSERSRFHKPIPQSYYPKTAF